MGEESRGVVLDLPVNPEAFFTTLPSKILFRVTASAEPLRVRLELDDGCCIESEVYSIVVSTHGREDVTLAVTFEGAQPVLGAKFLEDLGLRVDAESGTLGPVRHRGFPYNLEP